MRKLTTAEFIAKAISIHGNKYDYSLVNYTLAHSKVRIICPIHGEFIQKAYLHIQFRGCPKCGEINTGISRSKTSFNRKYKNLIQPVDYKLIPLTRGKFAMVDNDDFINVSKLNWQYHPRNYATHTKIGKMHRFIMKCPNDKIVDHINHNPLDNRKSNLRICDNQQNSYNTRPTPKTSSKYKGVSFFSRNGKWRATISCNGKFMSLGYFFNEVDAAVAYDIAAIEHFKEFAFLNFPELKNHYLACNTKKETAMDVVNFITS